MLFGELQLIAELRHLSMVQGDFVTPSGLSDFFCVVVHLALNVSNCLIYVVKFFVDTTFGLWNLLAIMLLPDYHVFEFCQNRAIVREDAKFFIIFFILHLCICLRISLSQGFEAHELL